ncbi:MAG TPA: hypothetical protein VML19_23860 [Verrucomicrobiae bacterium]|nr:hypothetical protein [Verrucomicrobiae bacterium]
MQYPEPDWLEQELKSALARKDPPGGFADGVGRKLAGSGPKRARGKVIEWPVRPARRWIAAAAAVVLAVGGAAGYRRYQGEMAKRQMMQAFFIAGSKLNHVQTHVLEVSQ